MTTPQERYRALAHFNELLDLASADGGLPEHLRRWACALRETFPNGAELEALVRSGRQGLPPATADALGSGIAWLHELGRTRPISKELLRWWTWTDRHFPTMRDVADQVDAAGRPRSFLRPSIDAWLHPRS